MLTAKTVLESSQINQLIKMFQVVAFKKGQTILKQGEVIEGLYFILSGVIKSVRMIPLIGGIDIQTLQEGDFFAEQAFFKPHSSLMNFHAHESCECLFINMGDLYKLKYTHNALYIALLEQVALSNVGKEQKTLSLFCDNLNTTKQFWLKKQQEYACEPFDLKSMERFRNHFLSSQLFNDFEFAELKKWLLNQPVIKVPKHRALLNVNEVSDSSYLLLDGAIELINPHPNFTKIIMAKPIDIIFPYCCFTSYTNPFEVFARNDALLVALSKDSFKRLKDKQPFVHQKIETLFFERMVNFKQAFFQGLTRSYTFYMLSQKGNHHV